MFDAIRDLFSRTQEARARGYKPGRFSFNVKGGRCEVCRGDGQIKIEMHFLPDVYVPCEQCDGKRYNRETLEVRFKGRTIADVLDMTVEEAVDFFQHIPKIKRKMQALHDVGLDYVRLGQPATTLSGGEAQRVKLASELSKVATGRTLYILDEPTTGLHFADVQRLLDMLQRLVDSGNTVVVIEHNLDVIKTADRIIDMGPEGGEEGGTIVAQGRRPEPAAPARPAQRAERRPSSATTGALQFGLCRPIVRRAGKPGPCSDAAGEPAGRRRPAAVERRHGRSEAPSVLDHGPRSATRSLLGEAGRGAAAVPSPGARAASTCGSAGRPALATQAPSGTAVAPGHPVARHRTRRVAIGASAAGTASTLGGRPPPVARRSGRRQRAQGRRSNRSGNAAPADRMPPSVPMCHEPRLLAPRSCRPAAPGPRATGSRPGAAGRRGPRPAAPARIVRQTPQSRS